MRVCVCVCMRAWFLRPLQKSLRAKCRLVHVYQECLLKFGGHQGGVSVKTLVVSSFIPLPCRRCGNISASDHNMLSNLAWSTPSVPTRAGEGRQTPKYCALD